MIRLVEYMDWYIGINFCNFLVFKNLLWLFFLLWESSVILNGYKKNICMYNYFSFMFIKVIIKVILIIFNIKNYK